MITALAILAGLVLIRWAYCKGVDKGIIDGLILAQSLLIEAEQSPLEPDMIHRQRKAAPYQ